MDSIGFSIRYDRWFIPLARALGIGPKRASVEVTADAVKARMGWAFHARIPLTDIRAAQRAQHSPGGGWGVHGWAGHWLVNGSAHGIVRVDIDPPTRANVLGVPVRLTTLLVGLDDPDDFVSAVHRATHPAPGPA